MTRHGTPLGYRDDGCRCSPCRDAIAREHNVYKLRRTANGGLPLTVSKLGAVRRLQALMAFGWPRRELARRAGYQGDAFALILNGRRQRLELATDRRIRSLYDQLCMTPGPSSSSRIRAASRGWPTPLAWDNIDDPDERPASAFVFDHGIDHALVERVLGGENLPANTAERHEIMRRWKARGMSEASLCARIGWKEGRYDREQAIA